MPPALNGSGARMLIVEPFVEVESGLTALSTEVAGACTLIVLPLAFVA